EQPSHQDRQRGLHDQRGRPADADAQGSAAAEPRIFPETALAAVRDERATKTEKTRQEKKAKKKGKETREIYRGERDAGGRDRAQDHSWARNRPDKHERARVR